MSNPAPNNTDPQSAAQAEKGRPFALDPLFKALTALPGIGPRNGKLLEKLVGGPKIWDLLCHLPIDLVRRPFRPTIGQAPAGEIATLKIRVDHHTPAPKRNLPHRVRCSDDAGGTIELVFFHANRQWLDKQLPPGQVVLISGKVDIFRGMPQIVHPDTIARPDEPDAMPESEPVYPLTAGITNKVLIKGIHAALQQIGPLEEWLDDAHLKQTGWPAWDQALRQAHTPEDNKDLAPDAPARARLAYDELLSNQLALALIRARQKKKKGRAYSTAGAYRDKLMAALPYTLTGAQTRSLAEIDGDMGAPWRMLRLLQGDVGSGKTVVAALAMLNAVESGCQAALMAPTEILARQHAQSLKPLLEQAGVRCIIITGRDKGQARQTLLNQIANGAAQVVIGTHALFQEDIRFADLGLAVIDEQHRFGVHQRMQLSAKGNGVDMLVMTATPIPRTLALTAYGDMDVSRLDEKPPGRQPVDTRLLSKDKMEEMVEGLTRQIQDGAQAYWVCPLVEESDVLDVAAAEERYQILQARFGDKVALVHGRMKGEDKDTVMQRFAAGEISILVATTVIEVGVNVPNATIMVIEHAERFGLAQLHQLRGRVGRGSGKSFCFLVYALPLSDTAKERLRIMRETEDGFMIAEKDMELRGSGEILGTRQSGLPTFRLADIADHGDLLATARNDARLILDKDPQLTGKRGQALRSLLYLFERDQAIRYLRSG